MARRTKYSAELAHVICERIAGGETLREICRGEEMPDKATVLRWLGDEAKAEFRDQYARARELQADHYAEELLEIADDGSNDWMERRNKDGSTDTVLDHEHVQRSKLRVDARKWLMSKLAPKKYGDRQEIEHSGNIPVQFIIEQ